MARVARAVKARLWACGEGSTSGSTTNHPLSTLPWGRWHASGTAIRIHPSTLRQALHHPKARTSAHLLLWTLLLGILLAQTNTSDCDGAIQLCGGIYTELAAPLGTGMFTNSQVPATQALRLRASGIRSPCRIPATSALCWTQRTMPMITTGGCSTSPRVAVRASMRRTAPRQRSIAVHMVRLSTVTAQRAFPQPTEAPVSRTDLPT